MRGRSLAFWTALPLVAPQALALRRRAPRLPPAAGPDGATVGAGPARYRLLGIGDSIIAGVGARDLERALVGQVARSLAAALDGAVAWQALGRTGYDTARVRERLVPRLPEAPCDGFVVSVGVNDVLALSRRGTFRRQLEALIADLARHSPDSTVVFCGVPPLGRFPLPPQPLRAVLGLRAGLLDAVLAEVADAHPATRHLPVRITAEAGAFCADGFHPSERSYQALGEAAAQRLLDGGGCLRPPSRP